MTCPGSVALSEGLPDKTSPWALEGTEAHEVLEKMMRHALAGGGVKFEIPTVQGHGMLRYAREAAHFILGLHVKVPDSEVLVETKISLQFLHPEMFGTFDAAVVDHFGTLHVFDYKYGSGHAVSPVNNLQMVTYGLGLAHQFGWNFKSVKLWIIQPRVRGYDGPLFWELPILELKAWVPKFEQAIERVEKEPERYVEGGHCRWCRAKTVCPKKRAAKEAEALEIFRPKAFPV